MRYGPPLSCGAEEISPFFQGFNGDCDRWLFHHGTQAGQALSFDRPFARRAFRIRRPAFVAMRDRNPWRRLRTRFDGWKVRFIVDLHRSRPGLARP